jgi:hypothetical protein
LLALTPLLTCSFQQEKESDKSKDSKENIGYVAARKSPIIEVKIA